MKIGLSFLSDWMSERFPDTSRYIRRDRALRGVRMYRAGRVLREDQCYICKPDKFAGDVCDEGSYILIGRDDDRFAQADRLVIMEETDSASVFELVQDTFDLISQWERSVSEAVALDSGIQKILELSSEIFGYNTLVVTSVSRMVLGYVQNSGPGQLRSLRAQVSGQEYMQPHPILNRMEDNLIDDDRKAPYFREEFIADSNLRMLRTNLFSERGYVIGRLTIAEYGAPLKSCHEELAAYLARQLRIALERTIDVIRRNRSSGMGGLSTVLKEGIRDEHTANQLRALTGWDKDERYDIAVIDFGEAGFSTEEYVHSLSFTISNEFPRSQILILDGRMVVICNKKRPPVIAHEFGEWLRGCMRNLNFKCGVPGNWEFTRVLCSIGSRSYAICPGLTLRSRSRRTE